MYNRYLIASTYVGNIIGQEMVKKEKVLILVYIGVDPITQLRTCVIKSNIQGRSPNVEKVIFHTIRNCSQRKELAPPPLGANSFL